ncbi:MAG TPA: substrate-binding domain-containing protein [Pararhizobium sp.]|uniref:substrate-binding domain-containing protein n=1 Tax=Pararhizobium sp. TaxID=1977563 RepID=UPI002B56AD05|nr:substrate-binding domain-containing protein [Pararhizobium sp.]HTO32029.1 substrate-binding domain-containing protein [Pararhizobium sp.]
MGRAERFRGFRDGALSATDAHVDDIVFDESAGFRGTFLTYLRSGKSPTALFCAHDGTAITVVSELLRLGVRVPEEISVIAMPSWAQNSAVGDFPDRR